MYKLALLFAILAAVQAQLISDGQCDFSVGGGTKSIKSIKSTADEVFNFYEIERINNTWNIGHCTSLNLTITNVTGTLEVFVEMKEVLDHKLIERNATVTPDKDVEFVNLVFKDFNSNFTIIGGGATFAIAYACSNVGEEKKQEYAWVLGINTTTLTETDKILSKAFIDAYKLTNATWVETSHTADACRSGTNYIKLSPIIVLIVGFLVTKGL